MDHRFQSAGITDIVVKDFAPFWKTLHIQYKPQRHQGAIIALFLGPAIFGLGVIFSGTFKKCICQIVENDLSTLHDETPANKLIDDITCRQKKYGLIFRALDPTGKDRQNRNQMTLKGVKLTNILNAFLAASTEQLIKMAA